MRKEKWCFDSKYVAFWWGRGFELSYAICGYFDNRPQIHISLFFFHLIIKLPFRNKWTDECDAPKWGLAVHSNSIWIHTGGKGNLNGGNTWWTWNIPFFTENWVRTSILLKDGSWEHEIKNNRKDFYKEEWKNKQMCWEYDYLDKYDNTKIPTKIYVDEREWRRKWLGWTKVFAKVRRTIDVHFSKEVGPRKGSWKGGTVGCGYELLSFETPIECIKRMESGRDFS